MRAPASSPRSKPPTSPAPADPRRNWRWLSAYLAANHPQFGAVGAFWSGRELGAAEAAGSLGHEGLWREGARADRRDVDLGVQDVAGQRVEPGDHLDDVGGGERLRSEEHTSELPTLMRISTAAFCLK